MFPCLFWVNSHVVSSKQHKNLHCILPNKKRRVATPPSLMTTRACCQWQIAADVNIHPPHQYTAQCCLLLKRAGKPAAKASQAACQYKKHYHHFHSKDTTRPLSWMTRSDFPRVGGAYRKYSLRGSDDVMLLFLAEKKYNCFQRKARFVLLMC